MKKQIVIVLSVLALAIAALTLGRGQQPSSKTAQPSEVPDHVMYKHLFHHVMVLKKKAEDAQKEGKDGTQFKTHFIRKAKLAEEQNRVLEDVAAELEQDEQAIASRAKPLVAAYRAQYPNGQVPHGQSPGPPPAELRKLSEERDASVLRARDRLRARFGDDEFKRFDNFVKTKIAPNIQIHN